MTVVSTKTHNRKSVINSIKTPNFWFVPAATAFIGGVTVLFFIKPAQNISSTKEISPYPTEQHYPVDNENDGVYTDYKYGVMFKYPNEIFKYQKELYEKEDFRNIYWDKLADGSSYVGGNKQGGFLSLYINSYPISKGDRLRDFEHIYSSQVGFVNPTTSTMEYETKKIRNLAVKGGEGMVFERLTDQAVYDEMGNYLSSGPEYFLAAWRKGENTFWLTVSTNSEDEAGYYQDLFNDIVASFAFIEPPQQIN